MLVIKNGRIITENSIISGKDIIIEDGRIKDIVESKDEYKYTVFDANGRYIFPGLIEINSTTFQNTINSMDGENIDYNLVLSSIDDDLVTKGYCLVYHSFTISNINESISKFKQIVELSNVISLSNLKLKHRIHVVLDAYSDDIIDELSKLIKSHLIHELSIKSTNYIDYDGGQKSIITDSDINNLINLAIAHKIIIVGNGLEDNVKLAWMKKSNINSCRFPSTLEMAKKVLQKEINIIFNEKKLFEMQLKSNVISEFKNATSMNTSSVCLETFSDDLIKSLFKISYTNDDLPIYETWKLISTNPAKAFKIYDDYGLIENGKIANIFLVDFTEDNIIVKNNIIEGNVIYTKRS